MIMKDIKIVFDNDFQLCYDGLNTKEYKAGQVYSPTHAHEAKMFEAFLADGRASLPSEKKAEEKSVPTTKVVKPKQKKTVRKSKK